MNVFYYLSFIAITTGGVISAFTARKPARLMMWLTAYLVLVVGVVQFGLIYCWDQLGINPSWPCVAGFIIYNLGNVAVVAGRILKGRRSALNYVYLGGATLAISMILLIAGTGAAPFSIPHFVYLAFTIVILISMPIGVTMSARRQKQVK